ncbi:MAG: hypothetical protein NPIRA02_33410 [Nitrospirales bacterium]|nr:MAG: hypothetical protein NPIRA02_33410 [Nitrospirales bacterium]
MRLRKTLTALGIMMGMALVSYQGFAADATFPSDWKTWKPVTTAVSQIGGLPGCDADVSGLPPIYQETVATYCAIRPEGPGKAQVLVKPDSLDAYKTRSGKYAKGENFILHLSELKVLFVTGHQGGAPVYGVYTEDGKNITTPTGPLSTKTCITCHSGFTAFCNNGQCGRVMK